MMTSPSHATGRQGFDGRTAGLPRSNQVKKIASLACTKGMSSFFCSSSVAMASALAEGTAAGVLQAAPLSLPTESG